MLRPSSQTTTSKRLQHKLHDKIVVRLKLRIVDLSRSFIILIRAHFFESNQAAYFVLDLGTQLGKGSSECDESI